MLFPHSPPPPVMSQLLLHECTFINGSTKEAVQHGHSTAAMAGKFASDVSARRLVLTHFSNAEASRFVDSAVDAIPSAHSFTVGTTDRVRDDAVDDDGAMALRTGTVKFPYPAVVDPSPAMRFACDRASTAAGGAVDAVIAARDFMTFPVPPPGPV